MVFEGFEKPTENWSKLPHKLIHELPNIKTLSELKVILYVLRHTYGWHDYDIYKRISLNEFQHGRKHSKKKRKETGKERQDNGCGLSRKSILAGLRAAVEHGYLEVEIDDTDKARIKHEYRLKYLGVENLHPRGGESTPRT